MLVGNFVVAGMALGRSALQHASKQVYHRSAWVSVISFIMFARLLPKHSYRKPIVPGFSHTGRPMQQLLFRRNESHNVHVARSMVALPSHHQRKPYG